MGPTKDEYFGGQPFRLVMLLEYLLVCGAIWFGSLLLKISDRRSIFFVYFLGGLIAAAILHYFVGYRVLAWMNNLMERNRTK
jgi:hypothetical protein